MDIFATITSVQSNADVHVINLTDKEDNQSKVTIAWSNDGDTFSITVDQSISFAGCIAETETVRTLLNVLHAATLDSDDVPLIDAAQRLLVLRPSFRFGA